ncbi:DUF4097 family beta strand repeat-containing protein [Streptomyces sp. NPDC056749]|uniref:DUF4097 family beta strand repeat-containing protein n=1 Tax=Streptomyces sp. NPDC056749 TaxID=3345936 RepID=UPI0036918142
MQNFDTPALVSTTLDVPSGLIRIVASDRTDTSVEVRPADASKSRDMKAAEGTEVSYRDGVLRIAVPGATSRVLGNSGSVEVTVQLPAGSHVDARTAAAGFRGVGRLGDVTFEGAAGSVELDETASAHLTLQAGDIAVGRLGGPGEISTQKGGIRVAEAAGGPLTLRTEAGDISVTAARGVSAALDAGTGYGRIDNALKNTEGTPSLHIKATTSYGDITARSL